MRERDYLDDLEWQRAAIEGLNQPVEAALAGEIFLDDPEHVTTITGLCGSRLIGVATSRMLGTLIHQYRGAVRGARLVDWNRLKDQELSLAQHTAICVGPGRGPGHKRFLTSRPYVVVVATSGFHRAIRVSAREALEPEKRGMRRTLSDGVEYRNEDLLIVDLRLEITIAVSAADRRRDVNLPL
jgi:hypothetical protein